MYFLYFLLFFVIRTSQTNIKIGEEYQWNGKELCEIQIQDIQQFSYKIDFYVMENLESVIETEITIDWICQGGFVSETMIRQTLHLSSGHQSIYSFAQNCSQSQFQISVEPKLGIDWGYLVLSRVDNQSSGFILIVMLSSGLPIVVLILIFCLIRIIRIRLKRQHHQQQNSDVQTNIESEQLPIIVVYEINIDQIQDKNTQCVICLNELKQGLSKTKCNHIFHTECIKVWLSNHKTCPTCRFDVR